MIGLGRMGSDMVRRLMQGGHEVVVNDLDAAAVEGLVAEGATGAADVGEAARLLKAPRLLWSMVPAGDATEEVVEAALAALEPGDVLVDGANSNWKDSLRRAELAAERRIGW